MSQPVIRVENLSKSYRLGQISTGTLSYDLAVWWAKVRGQPNPLLKIGEKDHADRDGENVWALKDVSLQVKQGEVLGIIGRNGAGKSTLLKILSRVTAPTAGRVKVKGRIASLLEVGTGFHPDLTGRENTYLNGAILGMSKEEVRRKFDEIVAFAEIEQFIDTPVKRYSSGMYVRLAFAVAAHLEPEILLIDEVLAVGDASFQKKCLGKMGDIAHQGRTVLFVSHDMTNISILCNTAILLKGGAVLYSGNAKEVVARYLNDIPDISLSKKWSVDQAPGDSDAKLLEINISKHASDKITLFFLCDSVIVQILYQVFHSNLRINPVVVVRDAAGTIVFSTSNYENKNWGEHRYAHGIYRATCQIPPHLFNNGNYFVEIMIIHETRFVKARTDSPLLINFHDDGSTRGDYIGDWNGVVRPICNWDVEKVNQE